MNLQELRDAVRIQIDFDEEDLPNSLVDQYLREAFHNTINSEGSWPFYQSSWDLIADDGDDRLERPSDLERVASLIDVGSGERLWQINHDAAEDNMLGRGGSGVPRMFSLWGNHIWLWPASNTERHYRLRGYRKPRDWVGQGAGGVVDADERLHGLLVHYAVSRVYAQQEDDILEELYRRHWMAAVENARLAITRPDVGTPVILNGGLGVPRRVSSLWRLKP